MRRIIIEAPKKEIDKIEKNTPLQDVTSSEILHLLKFDREEFAFVAKVKFKEPTFKIEDYVALFGKKDIKVTLLDQNKDGAYTYFVTGKTPPTERQLLSFGGYPFAPFQIKNDKAKMAFLGEARQIKNLLSCLGKLGVNYRIVSLSDAKFTGESPLSRLTEKQRNVLVSAFEHGYYETPRRIDNEALAGKLHLKTSTVVEHRRKAEQRLLSEIIKKS
ncbi:MAG: helix-turn-helix domain-containing protein [Candidatus Bathyarchaeota archaeon]|nr:helix-turn-helix domain-containing protein [Candidatus Bathyarchaeota archaeon]